MEKKKNDIGDSAKQPVSAKKESSFDKNIPGVHIINSQDAESHFKSSGSAENKPLTEVRIRMDQKVWERAQAAALQNGIELPSYVEQALEQFRLSNKT